MEPQEKGNGHLAVFLKNIKRSKKKKGNHAHSLEVLYTSIDYFFFFSIAFEQRGHEMKG
jgi:hypothetical protein